MEVLKVVDTEAIGTDTLKQVFFPVPAVPNSNPATFYDSAKTYTSEGIIPVLNETIRIEANNFTFDQLNEIAEQNNGLSILTHKTTITTPNGDIDENTFNYNNYATDAFSYYNIRNDEYEDYTQTNNEKILPNFCLGAAWARLGETPEQENYYTMFGAIPALREADVLAGATPINNYEFDDEFLAYSEGAEEKMDYFKVMLANGDTPRTTYQNANTHVYVDFNYNLNDSGQIGNTPFFNRIRLPVLESSRVLVDNTRDNQNLNTFSRMVKVFEESGMTDRLIKSFRNSNSFMRSFDINGATSDLKVYDVVELFENIGYIGSLTDSDEMYLRSAGQNYARDDNSPFTFYFYKLLLLGKLRNVIKNRLLSFKDIVVDNIDHIKEHVGFKVIKKIQGRNTPIQTFYFLNRRGLEDFIDTQVKFDRVYNYEVIAMYAVYGSNYTYESISAGVRPVEGGELVQGDFLEIQFTNRPSVKIVEVPFASHTLRIVEPPPLVPEITFYNEMTSRNKLKIRMEHQDGNLVDEFNPKQMRPFAGNEVYIEKLTQYFNSVDVLITSGKTSDGVYEIYRLEEPPQTYKDFEGALIATVQSSTIFSNGEASRNVMFTDLIKHQKKYYYAFRVLTHRGNPSELSPIYVAEMYEDADETFLTFDLYLEPEVRDYQNVYNMRKYIQILPNFEQTIPNEQELLSTYTTADDAIGDIKLGNPDLQETIWDYNNKDKYIKLRLESKSSGRKTDLNLYFKIK